MTDGEARRHCAARADVRVGGIAGRPDASGVDPPDARRALREGEALQLGHVPRAVGADRHGGRDRLGGHRSARRRSGEREAVRPGHELRLEPGDRGDLPPRVDLQEVVPRRVRDEHASAREQREAVRVGLVRDSFLVVRVRIRDLVGRDVHGLDDLALAVQAHQAPEIASTFLGWPAQHGPHLVQGLEGDVHRAEARLGIDRQRREGPHRGRAIAPRLDQRELAVSGLGDENAPSTAGCDAARVVEALDESSAWIGLR